MTRVLFTGASSFTGTWFVTALAGAGAEVVAACRGPLGAGDADRRRRLARLEGFCRLVGECPFGSEPFLDLLRRQAPFDLLCHHGAKTGDHRDLALDPLAAAAAHGRELERVLDAAQAAGCRAVLLTGTVFEADEGRGDPPLRAIGAYGLAKTLTWHIFRHHAEARGLPLAKFVVAHPFGPLEQPGLCRSLARAWLAGETPVLRRPHLARDQILVEGLAEAYAAFAMSLALRPRGERVVPSQFPERLDRFVRRLAEELGRRLRVPCRHACADPPDPSDEPEVRCGLDPLERLLPGFDAEAAWDRYARFLLTSA